ncbi:MAG: hypothetical protein ACE5GY_06515 [Thermodesulfobacteriota bacterium]
MRYTTAWTASLKRALVVIMLALVVVPLAGADAFAAGGASKKGGPYYGRRVYPSAGRRTLRGARRRGKRARPARFRNYEELWSAVWKRGESTYRLRAAVTVRNVPLCAGDVAGRINAIVMDTARSIIARKYGDAARSLAEFQDRLMCLDVKSMQALDFMMAAFMANATELPAKQRRKAVKGVLNAMLLVFDQIQYTGRSYSLPVLYHMRGHVDRALATYSGEELGLWFYDYGSGAMVRRTFGARDARFKNGLMGMLSNPGRFRNGECTMLEMASQGFSCGGVPGLGSGGGGGGGGMPASSGGALGCMTSAAAAGGLHGQLQCMAKAGGTGGFDAGKGHPGLSMNGILDGFCTGATSKDPPQLEWFKKDKSVEHSKAKKKGWWTSLKASLDITSSDSGSAPDAGTPDGGAKYTPEQIENMKKIPSLTAEERRIDREAEEWRKRTAPKSISEDASGCGASTNAVARANRLFSCTGIGGGAPGGDGGPLAGQNAPGTRSTPAPGSSGGYSSGGGMSGLMSCAAQGGSLVRTSMNDKRCSQSMCAPGQSCSCNGGGSATPEMKEQVRRGIFSPNRPNVGAKDPRPDDTGVGGNPTWGGGGSGPSTNPFGGRGTRGGR